MGFFETVGTTIWSNLEPFLESKWKEIEPKLWPWLNSKWDEFAPRILKTILVGMAQGAGQLVVDTENKVTDIIPGKVDDDILDPIVKNGMDQLKKLFPGTFGNG